MDVSVYTEYEVQGSETTLKIRYDFLYSIYSFTITVLIYSNPHIKFREHLDQD